MDISPSTLVLITTGTAFLSAFLGGTVSSIVNFLMARSARQSEERRQVRALVVQAALESWKQKPEDARFDVFLLHMAKTTDVVFDPETNVNNLEERLKPIDDMTEIMNKRAVRLGALARR